MKTPEPAPEQRTEPLAAATCSADVADFTGYHFHKCRKPAKWDVGNYGARCGIHARGKYFEGIRKPLPPHRGIDPNSVTPKPEQFGCLGDNLNYENQT